MGRLRNKKKSDGCPLASKLFAVLSLVTLYTLLFTNREWAATRLIINPLLRGHGFLNEAYSKPTNDSIRGNITDSEFFFNSLESVIMISGIQENRHDQHFHVNSESSHASYAESNGYMLESHSHSKSTSADPKWRPSLIEQAYRNHTNTSLLLWADYSVVFLDCEPTIQSVYIQSVRTFRSVMNSSLSTPDIIVSIGDDRLVTDSLMIVRRSQWSEDFLEQWTLMSELWSRVGKVKADHDIPLSLLLSGVQFHSLINESMNATTMEGIGLKDQLKLLLEKPVTMTKSLTMNVYNSWKSQMKNMPESMFSMWNRLLCSEMRNHVAWMDPVIYNEQLILSYGSEWAVRKRSLDFGRCYRMNFHPRFDWHCNKKGVISAPWLKNQTHSFPKNQSSSNVHVIAAYISKLPDSGNIASNEVKKEYSRRHGYQFHFLNDSTKLGDGLTSGAWIKPHWVNHVYSKFEHFPNSTFILLDSDVVIGHCERSLQSILDQCVRFFHKELNQSDTLIPDVVVAVDRMQMVNSGVFILRATPWTRWFMDQWYILCVLMKQVRPHGQRDQDPFNMVLYGVTVESLLPRNTTKEKISEFKQMPMHKKLDVLEVMDGVLDRVKRAFKRTAQRHPVIRTKKDLLKEWNHHVSGDIRSHVALVPGSMLNSNLLSWSFNHWNYHPYGQCKKCKTHLLLKHATESTCWNNSRLL